MRVGGSISIEICQLSPAGTLGVASPTHGCQSAVRERPPRGTERSCPPSAPFCHHHFQPQLKTLVSYFSLHLRNFLFPPKASERPSNTSVEKPVFGTPLPWAFGYRDKRQVPSHGYKIPPTLTSHTPLLRTLLLATAGTFFPDHKSPTLNLGTSKKHQHQHQRPHRLSF